MFNFQRLEDIFYSQNKREKDICCRWRREVGTLKKGNIIKVPSEGYDPKFHGLKYLLMATAIKVVLTDLDLIIAPESVTRYVMSAILLTSDIF